MNEYTILITATSEKRVKVRATNKDEALALGFGIINFTDLLEFNDDDVTELTGVVEDELVYYDDDDDSATPCEHCVHCCDECGACLLDDEPDTDEEECFNCPYYCNECGACHYDGKGEK